MVIAVAETLDAVPYNPRDAAIRMLIKRYAAEIDATGTTEKLGSRLATALHALEATPHARRAVPATDSPSDDLGAFFRTSA